MGLRRGICREKMISVVVRLMSRPPARILSGKMNFILSPDINTAVFYVGHHQSRSEEEKASKGKGPRPTYCTVLEQTVILQDVQDATQPTKNQHSTFIDAKSLLRMTILPEFSMCLLVV